MTIFYAANSISQFQKNDISKEILLRTHVHYHLYIKSSTNLCNIDVLIKDDGIWQLAK